MWVRPFCFVFLCYRDADLGMILKVVCILSLLPPHVYVSALVENLLPLTSHNYLFPSPLSPLPPHHWSVNTDLTFLHIPPCSRRLTPDQEKAPPSPPPSPPQSVTQEHHPTAFRLWFAGSSGFLIRASSRLCLGGSNTSVHVKGEPRTVRRWVVPSPEALPA